jgi:hypothetical protein
MVFSSMIISAVFAAVVPFQMKISELPVAHARDGHDPRDLIQITRNWFLAACMLYEFGGAINHGEP